MLERLGKGAEWKKKASKSPWLELWTATATATLHWECACPWAVSQNVCRLREDAQFDQGLWRSCAKIVTSNDWQMNRWVDTCVTRTVAEYAIGRLVPKEQHSWKQIWPNKTNKNVNRSPIKRAIQTQNLHGVTSAKLAEKNFTLQRRKMIWWRHTAVRSMNFLRSCLPSMAADGNDIENWLKGNEELWRLQIKFK